MRIRLRSALVVAFLVAPSAALAQLWSPAMPEEEAAAIAYMNGVVLIVDVRPQIDNDWKIEGRDVWGHEVEMVIDGTTGRIERFEVED